jgi:hypothetical protein
MLALTACASDVGDQPAQAVVTASPTFTGAQLCTTLSTNPQVAEDDGVTVAGTKQTTMTRLRTWGATHNGPNGPQDDVARDLDATAPDDSPVEVCVFHSTKDRPISHPPGGTTRYNGIRVFARAADRFAIDAYGEVTGMVSQLDALNPSN